MSADATSVKYECPFCDVQKPSKKKIQTHVTGTDSGDHKGVNGYTMDRVINVVDESGRVDIDLVKSERELNEKIAKASEQFDIITRDEIEKIAEAAEVHYTRVIRVFKDEDIPFNVSGKVPTHTWGGLTDLQKQSLKEWNGKSDDRSSYEIAKGIDGTSGTVKSAIEKYGWLKLPLYMGNELSGGEVKTVGKTEEMIQNHNGSEPTSEEKDLGNILSTLVECDVDFTIEVEDDFGAICALVENGEKEVARELFEEDQLPI